MVTAKDFEVKTRKNHQQLAGKILKDMETSKYLGEGKRRLRDMLYERKSEA